MDPAALESLRARLRACDRELLRALAARARGPRRPAPAWPGNDPRRPPPPLAEILHVLAPSGTAGETGAADRRLVAALAACGKRAGETAAAKAGLHPEDFHAALAGGDRERLALLLADLAGELDRLDFICKAAPEAAPDLPPGLSPCLWRECILPWARAAELAHLAAP